jgi:histidinol-phosphate aminotransferase
MPLQLPPVPERIKQLTPYKPGKPIEELERELGITGAIKMASNENPLGPSPKAREAVRQCAANLHRYPDGAAFELRTALARRLGLELNQVAVTNGSNEMIELLCRAFVRPGDKVIAAQYPFSMYAKLVTVAGGELVEVPLKDFQIDLDGLGAAMDEATRLVFVNSPHNPAGSALTREEFSRFLDQTPPGVLVVADEAYIDFADDPDVARGAELVNNDRPLVVMRTFSKSYGLAGLRIGVGLGPVAVMDILNRVRQAFNTSIPAQVAALAALSDEEFLKRSLGLVIEGRKMLYQAFEQLGLWHQPSQANFVLVKVGPRAMDIHQALLRRGVIVRPMDSYELPEYLRISVGTEQENQRFIKEFSALVQERS